MLISAAYAAGTAADAGGSGSAGQAFMFNMMMIVTMVALFYFMMIVPQQKRFRKHKEMLEGLRKGDKVITAGGLIGTVDKVKDGEDEVVVDLGNGLKVTALRSTIQTRQDKTTTKDTK